MTAPLALESVDESLSGKRVVQSESWQEDLRILTDAPNRGWQSEESSNASKDTFVPQDEDVPHAQRIIRLKRSKLPQGSFRALQQWEAVVSEVTADSVWVQLHDLTNKNSPLEEAELLMAAIPEDDRRNLKPGSVLYWSIGIERAAGGQIQNVSRIRAKRSAPWSSKRLSRIRSKAKSLFEVIANDSSDTASV